MYSDLVVLGDTGVSFFFFFFKQACKTCRSKKVWNKTGSTDGYRSYCM